MRFKSDSVYTMGTPFCTLYFFAASAKLSSIASLRSLSSWLSSHPADRYSAFVMVEDVERDIDAVAVILFGDAVPGSGDIFNGVFHALGGLPLDRSGLMGVVMSSMSLPREEMLSLTTGNSFSSELVGIDRAISGDPGDPTTPVDQTSSFARGEV